MFFYISKVLGYLINPLTWIILALALAILNRNPRKKKRLLTISFLLLIFFTNPFLGDEVIRLWERPLEETPARHYTAGVLLCGDIASYDKSADRIIFRSGADRLLQIIELYQQGNIKKIIISGGSGHLIYKDRTEAAFVKKYLTSIGINADDILFESRSRNTHENARFTSVLLKENRINDTVVLVTSSLHMSRASACFKKQDVLIKEYPTSKITGDRLHNFDHLFIPSVLTLKKWDMVFHEIIGFITYKVMGYC